MFSFLIKKPDELFFIIMHMYIYIYVCVCVCVYIYHIYFTGVNWYKFSGRITTALDSDRGTTSFKWP